MTDTRIELYCPACSSHYLGDKAGDPCPQCSTPMAALEESPSLGDFLSDVVDEVIAEFNEQESHSLAAKTSHAQMLALVKIAFELERITP